MDLSQFSDADLQALASGDLTKVSDAGLTALHGSALASQPVQPPTQYQTTAPYDASLGAAHPVTAELEQGASNAWTSLGSFWPTIGQRLRQGYSAVTGGPSLDSEIQETRRLDAPLMATMGGKIGRAVPYAAIGLLGGGTPVGAAIAGGAMGLAQPTTAQDFGGQFGGNLGATAFNTALGAGMGALTTKVGQGISDWATTRSGQPFMGWTPQRADAVLADAVGSDAATLDQGALGERGAQLGKIYAQGRSAATSVDLAPTSGAYQQIVSKLSPSARIAFEGNPNVSDLLDSVTGTGISNGQALGNISTGLRQDAYTALNSEGGNREVGLALQQLRTHVEGLIQSNIADPALKAAYAAAGPQYGLLQDVRYNPGILNASTGRANMDMLGRYFQRNNPAYTSPNASDDPLFNAAQWGQSGGGAKGAPPWLRHFGLDRAGYIASNNFATRAAGGATSRALAPVAPAIPYGLGALGTGNVPIALPYLEQ